MGRKQRDRIRPTPKWSLFLPYGLAILGLLIFLLFAKGLSVFIGTRFFYSIPLLGGIARSLELVEFVNLFLFSVLGMGVGLSVQLLPHPKNDRISKSILTIIIPILFLSGCFFQYQIWLSYVRQDMGLNPIEVRTVTNQWLQQTVNKSGVWGFYHYTTRYSVLPTNPDRLEASIKGSDRVNELFSRIFSTTPNAMGNFLSFCVWVLRLFYFSLAILAAWHHFQDGLNPETHPAWLRKIGSRSSQGLPK